MAKVFFKIVWVEFIIARETRVFAYSKLTHRGYNIAKEWTEENSSDCQMCRNEECRMGMERERGRRRRRKRRRSSYQIWHIFKKSLDARFPCFFSSFLPNAQSTISQFNRKCSDSHTHSHVSTTAYALFFAPLCLSVLHALFKCRIIYFVVFLFSFKISHTAALKSRTQILMRSR